MGSREKKKKIRSRGWKKRELHNLEVVFAKKTPLSKANGNLKKSTRLFEGLDLHFFSFCNFNPFSPFWYKVSLASLWMLYLYVEFCLVLPLLQTSIKKTVLYYNHLPWFPISSLHFFYPFLQEQNN